MVIFSYYIKGRNSVHSVESLAKARAILRDWAKNDPNRVQKFVGGGYIERVSSSGAVRYFGIY